MTKPDVVAAVAAVEPKIEEIVDDSDSGDEELNVYAVTEDSTDHRSRSEMKAFKAMAKLGLKPVDGVDRVTIKRSKGVRGLEGSTWSHLLCLFSRLVSSLLSLCLSDYSSLSISLPQGHLHR